MRDWDPGIALSSKTKLVLTKATWPQLGLFLSLMGVERRRQSSRRHYLLPSVSLLLCVLNWSLGTMILRLLTPLLLLHPITQAALNRSMPAMGMWSLPALLAAAASLVYGVTFYDLGVAVRSVPWVSCLCKGSGMIVGRRNA